MINSANRSLSPYLWFILGKVSKEGPRKLHTTYLLLAKNLVPFGKSHFINPMCEVFSDTVDPPCETERSQDQSANLTATSVSKGNKLVEVHLCLDQPWRKDAAITGMLKKHHHSQTKPFSRPSFWWLWLGQSSPRFFLLTSCSKRRLARLCYICIITKRQMVSLFPWGLELCKWRHKNKSSATGGGLLLRI